MRSRLDQIGLRFSSGRARRNDCYRVRGTRLQAGGTSLLCNRRRRFFLFFVRGADDMQLDVRGVEGISQRT